MQKIRNFIVLLFSIASFILCAQPKLTIEQILHPGEHITSLSFKDRNLWYVKGVDSLGLGSIDTKGVVKDLQNASPSPIKYVLAKTTSGVFFSNESQAFFYDKDLLKQKNTTSSDIKGSSIIGFSEKDGKIRIQTDSGTYSSNDNIVYSNELPTFNERYKVRYLIPDGFIFYKSYNVCSFKNNGISASISLPQGTFEPALDIEDFSPINDYAHEEYSDGYPTSYIAQNTGLTIDEFDCNRGYKYLSDTAVYSIEPIDNKMFFGTENGIFYYGYTDSYIRKFISVIPELNNTKVYSLAYDNENGILWAGTDKGLYKLKYELIQPPKDFKESPLWMSQIGNNASVKSIASDKSGNVYITGSFLGSSKFGDSILESTNSKDYFLAKFNNKGKFQWFKTALAVAPAGCESIEEGFKVTIDENENVLVLGSFHVGRKYYQGTLTYSFNGEVVPLDIHNKFLTKYDSQGNIIWNKFLSGENTLGRKVLATDFESSIYVTDRTRGNGETGTLTKYDKFGNKVWNVSVTGLTGISKGKNSMFLTGIFHDKFKFENFTMNTNLTYCHYILNIDKDGKVLWGNNLHAPDRAANPNEGGIFDVAQDKAGYVYITGYREEMVIGDTLKASPLYYGANNYLAKINPKGMFSWIRRFGSASSEEGYIGVDSLGYITASGLFFGYFKIGKFSLKDSLTSNIYLIKSDPNGNTLTLKSLTAPATDYNVNPVMYLGENGIISAAFNSRIDILANGIQYKASTLSTIFVYQLEDTSLAVSRNKVHGRIYADKNQNKIFDLNDQPLGGLIIKTEPGEIYAQTDENGNYTMYLPKGTFTIQQVIPSRKGVLMSQIFPVTPGTYNIAFSKNNKDSSGFNFINKILLTSFITIDLNSIRRRRCFKGTTSVKYCNDGYADAQNKTIKVLFPKHVIPISSDIPWNSLKDKELTYIVPRIPAGTCKTINITDSVQCGDISIIGLVECTKATFSPGNNVFPVNDNWDKSNLQIKGDCANDGYIKTTVKNKGLGNMKDSTQARVFLDTSLVFASNYRIAFEDSVTLNIPANGKSFRMEFNQTKYNPDGDIVIFSLEGCKTNGLAASKGVLDKFPQNNEPEEVESSCLSIIGSFDPNDKRVFPSGITENYNIAETTELEYILRFQNSGTDTAFIVLVTDTLSDLLDISTFKPGITSHKAQWNISGEVNPVVSCKFDNILLPDSNVNERSSHGYLKFKIKPKSNIKGRQIRNKGYIYFDFNEAVITNEVMNTIGMPEFRLEPVLVQNCKNTFLKNSDSLLFNICKEESIKIPTDRNSVVFSEWEIVSGSGKIKGNSDSAEISNVEKGKNEFNYVHKFCNDTWHSFITINKFDVPSPPVSFTTKYCEGSLPDSISITGSSIKWYHGRVDKIPFFRGNIYTPGNRKSEQFYVSQSANDCESEKAIVNTDLLPKSNVPYVHSQALCYYEKTKSIYASGNNIVWYDDSLKTTILGNGNVIYNDKLNQGDTAVYYASQNVNGCESKTFRGWLTVKRYDRKEVVIPNLISNGTSTKFFLPHYLTNECSGKFLYASIADVNGKILFYSDDENFNWLPLQSKLRLFFYEIAFTGTVYKGKILVSEQ